MNREELIYSIGKVLGRDRASFDVRLQDAVGILAGHFEVEKCSVMLINHDDLTLEVKAATNPAIVGLKRKLSDVSIATRALLDDAPFCADKKRLSYFVQPDATQYSSAFSLSIPMKYRDKKLGVLNFTDTKNGRPLSGKQQETAIEVAGHLAVYFYAEQTREQLEAKVRKYEDTVARLMKVDELKTNLTSFIIHDLKGPISTIMANLDMLSYEPLTQEQLDYVSLALGDVYKMQRMVMNILDVMKLEEGKIKIFREETDLYALAEREVQAFKGVLAAKELEAVLEGGPCPCCVDESLIGRTISNLLTNAIEHSPEGKRIVVKVGYNGGRREAVVSMTDEGSGIPAGLKEKIFDKFFQIEEGNRYRKATTGLGLTFCKLAVNAHGGDIRIEDSEHGGARFVFTLPETLKEVIS